jgi:glycosyltransferase involved in cell wall biosynthesis
MDKKRPLLSICIPTYNRFISLKLCLDKLLNSCKGLEDFVEIIVSDNASDDGTEKFVTDLVSQNKNLKYFRNDQNLGFNFNIFLLTDKYSEGEFCWLIGDDDFVDKDAVKVILSILKENLEIDFVGLNFRLESFGSLSQQPSLNRDPVLYKSGFPSVINKMSRPGNLFITFISASIFRRDKFASFPKNEFNKDSWQNYLSTFPHTYIQLTVFKDSKAIFIENELLTAIIHEKDWHNMNSAIYLYSIPSLYKYSLSIGYKKKILKDSYKQIMNHAIRQIPKKINYAPVHFLYKFRFIMNEVLNFRFYICGIKIVKEKLF